MIWYQTKSWTKAKKQQVNGIQYDSKFEAGYGQQLELLKRAGEIKDFEAHKTIPLIVNGYHIADYKIDFVVYHNDGIVEYTECKGRVFPEWAIKWKIFCALFENKPNVKITLIKQGKQYRPRMRKIKL